MSDTLTNSPSKQNAKKTVTQHQQQEKLLVIRWFGPFLYDEIKKINLVQAKQRKNNKKDYNHVESLGYDDAYGVYQIYGAHPIYGSNVLMYIGKVVEQTFAERLLQHGWVPYNRDARNASVYVGRLLYSGNDKIQAQQAEQNITDAESVLIYATAPAANSSGVYDTKVYHEPIRVINVGQYRSLPSEVSTLSWKLEDEKDQYKFYTKP